MRGAAVHQIEAADADRATPQPLALIPKATAGGQYPLDALGPLIRGGVEAAMARAMVPAGLAAQSALAACSLAVQGHFDVELPFGAVRPASLFLLSVAESSDRKSTSDTLLMAAIADFEAERTTRFGADVEMARMRMKAWDEATKAATARCKGQGREALLEAYNALGPRPAAAEPPSIRVTPNTTQGLIKFFESCRPSLGFMSDEGGTWIGGHGMKDEGRLEQISVLSRFWDGATQTRLTAGEGFLSLPGRRLTMHMMIQPQIAGLLLANEQAQGQGFLNRILVTQPDSLAGQRIADAKAVFPKHHLDARDQFNARIASVIRARLPVGSEDNSLRPKVLKMTSAAKEMWIEFSNSVERRQGPEGDLRSIKGYAGKTAEQAARLAAVMGGVEVGSRLDEIDAPLLARGIALAEFYMLEALRLFGHAAPDPHLASASALADWLRDVWKEDFISSAAVQRSGPNRIRQLGGDAIRGLLETLVRHDHLVGPQSGHIGGKAVRAAYRIIRV